MNNLVFFALFGLLLIGCKSQESNSEVVHNYYSEPHRPQYHFSPPTSWMNDPNGMVYLDGEYHLFYQYYPDATVWGPMHWGHAVSTDLVHWQHLPIAIYPDTFGYIFSGSAVVDKDNTSGFGANAMIAIYTYHDMTAEKSGQSSTYQYQAIAYSLDKGRTFIKYEGNPVLPNPGIKDFRDPKVVWDADHQQWVMALAVADHLALYTSSNLKEWTHASDFGKEYGAHGGVWECPDFFPLIVSNTEEKKWVLLQSLNPGAPNGGSGTQYFIGTFDGKEFVLDPDFKENVMEGAAMWLDYGTDNYAGVTWSNTRNEESEKLFIGWMSNWNYAQIVPTERWRSAMTLPRKLKLYKEHNSYRLLQEPIADLQELVISSNSIAGQIIEGSYLLTSDTSQTLFKLDLSFVKPSNGLIEVRFENGVGDQLSIGYMADENKFFTDRSHAGDGSFRDDFLDIHFAPRILEDDTIDMVIYLDHSSIEWWVDQGRTCMTDIFFPNKPFSKISIIGEANQVELIQGKISHLKRIWE